MSTDSTETDGKRPSSASLYKKIIWILIYTIIYIIVALGCWIQMGLCIGFIISVIYVAVSTYITVHSEVEGFRQNFAVQFLDDFSGMAVTSRLNEATGNFYVRLLLISLAFILLASCFYYIALTLHRGLQKEIPEFLIAYFISGAIFLGVRISEITPYEYHMFPEDLTILYCGLYGLYLVMVLIVAVEMYRDRKRQAVTAATATRSDAAGIFAATTSRIIILRTVLVNIRSGDDRSTIPHVPV